METFLIIASTLFILAAILVFYAIKIIRQSNKKFKEIHKNLINSIEKEAEHRRIL